MSWKKKVVGKVEDQALVVPEGYGVRDQLGAS